MHDDTADVRLRLDRFLDKRVIPASIGRRRELAVSVWETPRHDVPFAEAIREDYRALTRGDPWGSPWSTAWFHITGEVPSGGWANEIRFDPGFGPGPGFNAEGLVYTAAGTIIKGLNPLNTWIPLAAVTVDNGTLVDFYVEGAANPAIFGFDPTDLGDIETAGNDPLYRIVGAELVEVQAEVVELAADLDVLRGIADTQSSDSARRHRIFAGIDRALNALDPTDIAATAEVARAILRPVLDEPAGTAAHRISAVGHAHIDSAWLWPLRETGRKVARTLSNVLNLIDESDDLVFAFSSAQQHEWVRERYPELWDRLKRAVAAGRVIPVGGMWVESDAVMPSGESMARQFLQGKLFFLEHYGIETKEAWLPDSFGYAGGLPQVIAKAGNQFFLSQKPSWNRTNKFPHHSFTWEGVDGTQLFAHLPPVDTYTSELSARELHHAETNYAEKSVGTRSLVPFGWGDGGGGPTREMLQRARRLRDISGSPRVTIEAPSHFFDAAREEIPHPAVWVGEIYMEAHRGTLTSQHKMKQGNRRVEALLREAEIWSTAAAVRENAAYPADQLRRIWREALLLQFHDILPGSAIRWVHREAAASYERLTSELESLIEAQQQVLAGEGESELELIVAPGEVGVVAPRSGTPALTPPRRRPDGSIELANSGLRLVIDERGHFSSLTVTADGRELVPSDLRLNEIVAHVDAPAQWDAWDIDLAYRDAGRTETEVLSIDIDGAAVIISQRVGSSTVRQTVTMPANALRVDIETAVEWREDEMFLRVYFPMLMNASESAAETQFGVVRRPVHENTTWSWAQFEVAAHRFLHLDETGFGAGFINDTIYGHSVDRMSSVDGVVTQVGLSLLRAPKNPDPTTDRGRHDFRYSLLVAHDLPQTVDAALRLPHPSAIRVGSHVREAFVSVTCPHVVVSAVKLAEDGSGDIIVRVYEAAGRRARTSVVLDAPVSGSQLTDLLERAIEGEGTQPGAIREITLRPFEVATVRFSRAREMREGGSS
jgi:alpha-mannosidase